MKMSPPYYARGAFSLKYTKYLRGYNIMKKNSSKLYIKKIVVMALFCAMAYVTCFFLRISGIGGFLSFEIKDTIIALAAMLFGPLAGVAISFVVALMEMISFSGTGPIGALMNFVSSAVFSACAGAVYIRKARHGENQKAGAVSDPDESLQLYRP